MNINYFACVNPDCIVLPKVLMTLEDQQKHSLTKCKMIELCTIRQDVFADQPFFDEITSNELSEHLNWANESLWKIHLGFKDFFAEFSFSILSQIKDNFTEIQRLKDLYQSLKKNEDIAPLKIVKGDLACLMEQCKYTILQQLLQQNQTLIYKQLKEFQSTLSQFMRKYPIEVNDIIKSQLQVITRQPHWWISQLDYLTQSDLFQVTLEANKKIKIMFIEGKVIQSDSFVKIFKLLIQFDPKELNFNYCQQFGNKISDIQPIVEIKQLLNLTSLLINLRNNLITDIKPMAGLGLLVKLKILVLDLFNKISDISVISELKSLMDLTTLKISLGSNQIRDINSISQLKLLTNLTTLEIVLRANQITDIMPISELKSLINLKALKIGLNNNQISDSKPILELNLLTNLTTLIVDLPKLNINSIQQLLLLTL